MLQLQAEGTIEDRSVCGMQHYVCGMQPAVDALGTPLLKGEQNPRAGPAQEPPAERSCVQ